MNRKMRGVRYIGNVIGLGPLGEHDSVGDTNENAMVVGTIDIDHQKREPRAVLKHGLELLKTERSGK